MSWELPDDKLIAPPKDRDTSDRLGRALGMGDQDLDALWDTVSRAWLEHASPDVYAHITGQVQLALEVADSAHKRLVAAKVGETDESHWVAFMLTRLGAGFSRLVTLSPHTMPTGPFMRLIDALGRLDDDDSRTLLDAIGNMADVVRRVAPHPTSNAATRLTSVAGRGRL